MKINVRSVHFDADAKLLAYVENKLSKLNRFFDKVIEAEVYLKLQPTSNKIQEKIAEVRIHVPGQTLFKKSKSLTFEEAMNNSINSLERQVKRFKQKRRGR